MVRWFPGNKEEIKFKNNFRKPLVDLTRSSWGSFVNWIWSSFNDCFLFRPVYLENICSSYFILYGCLLFVIIKHEGRKNASSYLKKRHVLIQWSKECFVSWSNYGIVLERKIVQYICVFVCWILSRQFILVKLEWHQ